MSNIFDSKFFDSPRWDMYKSWVFPELYLNQPKPRLENWHPDDLEAYCGIYSSGRLFDMRQQSYREAIKAAQERWGSAWESVFQQMGDE